MLSRKKLINKIVRLKIRFGVSENYFLIFLAILIGVLSAFGNWGLHFAIEFFHEHLFVSGLEVLGVADGGWKVYLLPLIPMCGGLLLIPLEMAMPGYVCGYGLPNFLKTVNLSRGRLARRNIWIKILAPAITIGSGGSAGQEGPIATIGGSIGQMVAGFFSFNQGRVRLLIACGVAGGIAATFNAPISGVFFALEIIMMGDIGLAIFTPVVIAAATSVVSTRLIFGNERLFVTPEFSLGSFRELLVYVAMGIVIGCFAALFIRFFYLVQDFFTKLRFPRYLKPALGGLLVGLIGVFFPQVMGDVYGKMGQIFQFPPIWYMALALVLMKILATSICLGSGGAGGLFAPIMFIGVVLGSGCGQIATTLFPNIVMSPDGYAVVGLGAFLSAVTHAPLTAIFLAYELTGESQIILPAMFATVVGIMVARSIEREGIDTFGLAREGIHLEDGREVNLMRSIKIGDVMFRGALETIPETMKLKSLLQFLPHSRKTTFPVVDSKGLLSGILSIQDLRELVYEQELEDLIVAKELAKSKVLTVTAHENLSDALRKIGSRNIDYLPVVADDNSRRMVGMVSRQDIISAYNRSLLERGLPGH
ncbi:MAG: chloride channel protein [Deltaproteobacteria bacterium]|nr:MAG: chloride channel protein [Deltaproteobacteria bacterium]